MNFFFPFFVIGLGAIIVGVEFKKELVNTYFGFLGTLFGRGIFNLFLASIAVFNSGGDGYYISMLSAWIFFGLGIFFIILSVCNVEVDDLRQNLI